LNDNQRGSSDGHSSGGNHELLEGEPGSSLVSSEDALRVAVLGLGKAGARHARAAMECAATRLVAVADSAPTARRSFQEIDGDVVETLEELLALRPEAVIIALPHSELANAARRACAAGVHILLEKPMATSRRDAREIVRQAEEASIRLMVNYNHRFREEYQLAKRLLDEGRIGRPVLFVDQMLAAKGPLPDWVWQHEKAGGGMMTYNGSHQLDRMMWLSGSKVADVQALTASLGYRRDLEDTALAHLRFENGAVGSVVQHKSVSSRTLEAWETLIYGSEGAIRVRSGTGVELSATGGNELIPTLPGNRFGAALEELAAAIREERSPRPDGRSSLHTLACLKALYQSARQGTRVPVLE